MRRVISVWLPRWPIDRLRRARRPAALPSRRPPAEPLPFALTAPGRHGTVLAAVNRQAEAEGLAPGMRLADARALLPRLAAAEARPAEDRRGLERLALWCNRFTPCCAVDGADGLLLDITGADHLFGGEAAMAAEVEARLAGLGFEARAGLADTPGAAWALARFGGEDRRIAAPGGTLAALVPLPVEALRIAPEDARLLRRLGLATIGAVDALPRASLARRFRGRSGAVLERLDRALGRSPDPVSSLPPPPACLARLAFPEPPIDLAGLEAALARLMEDLCASLERDGLGARELSLLFCRVDGGTARRGVSTARATRDGAHLQRLFDGKIETVDPGFGIDAMVLHAVRAEPLAPEQFRLAEGGRGRGELGPLIDRLQARLGEGSVCRLEPIESHLPERAERRAGPRPGSRDPARAAGPAAAPPPPVRPARAGGGRGRGAGRAAGAVHLAPAAPAASPAPRGPNASSRNGGPAARQTNRATITASRTWKAGATGSSAPGLYRDTGSGEPPRWYIHGLYG